MAPPTPTVALAAYAVAVAGAALLFAWTEARAFDAELGASGGGGGGDAADGVWRAKRGGGGGFGGRQNAFDPHATHALWTLYQPLLPPLLMWWLSCRAVHRYARRSVPYARCYPREERAALPTAGVLAAAAARASALAASAFAASVALLALGGGSSGGGATTSAVDAAALYVVPIAMYAGFLAWLLWPAQRGGAAAVATSSSGSSNGKNVEQHLTPRLLLRRTLARAFLPGALAPVGWADFYLADCLTSLSKSALDFERAACAALGAGPLRLRPSHIGASRGACGASSPPALLALCLPFFLRFCQCLIVYARARRGGGGAADPSSLANAGKYALAAAAAALTQLEHEHHVHGEPFSKRRLWIAASALSATFAWFWDSEFDWGLPWLAAWWRARRRGRRQPGRGKGKGGGGWGPLPPLLPRIPSSSLGAGARRPGSAAPKSALLSSAAGGGGGPPQQQQLNFPLLLATNAVLRFSWAHRLAGDLEAHSAVQMAVALLEVLRRHRWGHGRHSLELRRRADARRRERGDRRRRRQRALLLPPGAEGGGSSDGGDGDGGGGGGRHGRSSSSSEDGGGGVDSDDDDDGGAGGDEEAASAGDAGDARC